MTSPLLDSIFANSVIDGDRDTIPLTEPIDGMHYLPSLDRRITAVSNFLAMDHICNSVHSTIAAILRDRTNNAASALRYLRHEPSPINQPTATGIPSSAGQEFWIGEDDPVGMPDQPEDQTSAGPSTEVPPVHPDAHLPGWYPEWKEDLLKQQDAMIEGSHGAVAAAPPERAVPDTIRYNKRSNVQPAPEYLNWSECHREAGYADSGPSSSQDNDIDVQKQLAHMKASMLAICKKRYPSVASQQAGPEPEVDSTIVTPADPPVEQPPVEQPPVSLFKEDRLLQTMAPSGITEFPQTQIIRYAMGPTPPTARFSDDDTDDEEGRSDDDELKSATSGDFCGVTPSTATRVFNTSPVSPVFEPEPPPVFKPAPSFSHEPF
eukprot:gene10256-biopygen7417